MKAKKGTSAEARNRKARSGLPSFPPVGPSPAVNERLAKLVGDGVLQRRTICEMPPHVEYHLTAKGRELALLLVRTIRQFADRCEAGDPGRPASGPRVARVGGVTGSEPS